MLEKGFTVPELLQPALPPAVSWFPLPPGWIYLGFILLAVLLIAFFFLFARWRRNLWRRQAQALLKKTHNADNWLTLIKRILLTHQPRSQISRERLPGQLLQHVPVDEDLRQQLSARYCQPDNQLDESDNSRLRTQLSRWIKELPHV
ncbi:hypothetical protein AwEntero_28420 [Enterobacterales bacterium]|nr:hypothetical protein AwEntero_28420 [Enterobacterales bacterium]